MWFRLMLCSGVLMASEFCAFSDDVIISEIMYHPASDNVLEEYIEIHNRGTNLINLSGWKFTRGVDFVFNDDAEIEPGGYMVAAAHTFTFLGKYPGVANFFGGWTGQLANGGEEVRLEDAAGNVIDSVTYHDEGDWGIRRRGPIDVGHRGWEWFAGHDGLGNSLELRNLNLPNGHGHNWASSVVTNGTPGQLNSANTLDIPPMIKDVEHSPAIPTAADNVTITCEIVDEASPQVVVWYRTFGVPYAAAVMADDGQSGDGLAGDGVYGAILPPQADNAVVEFYVEASDGDNERTWPAQSIDEFGIPSQSANAVYQVGTDPYSGGQPLVRLIFTEVERNEILGINRQSNAEMNGTFISSDGVSTKIRYLVGVRIRGAGSRGASVPNYRVSFPSDASWNGQESLNVNAQYGHAQVAGAALVLKGGLQAAEAVPAQVRVNGVNYASSGAVNGYGSYALVEVVNADWANSHVPNDGNGNVYICRRPNTDLRYRGTDPVSYIGTGYSKSSNNSENDWTDLINLTFILDDAPDNTYVDDVRSVVNVEQWMTYFAFNTLLGNGETSLGTGVGDDYDMYRGINDPRFILVQHDLDTILAQGQGPAGVTADIFRAANVNVINRFIRHPEFVPFYFAELKRLIDTTLSEDSVEATLNRTLGEHVPSQTIDAMLQYSRDRNNWVLSQIPLALSVDPGLPTQDGYLYTTSSSVGLSGRANAIDTRAVRVNGVLASWTAWEARWNIGNVNLQPGINVVSIQSFDSNGDELEQLVLNIWYDDSSTTSVGGTLGGNSTWSAANGPYEVTSDVTVPSGSTLTIEAGTSVYFSPGTSLNVSGSLRVTGQVNNRVRLTRAPGTGGDWAGIRIDGSSETNFIRYTDFDFVGGGDALTVIDSTLFVEGATWANTTRTIIELDDASLTVRDSVFPNLIGEEHIHGGLMPAGGHVIIDGNTFGTTTGQNDIIDFTGAQRPGAVLQVINNTFLGASDDVVELHGADAHIEGNAFLSVDNGDPAAPDTSNAIAIGESGGQASEVVAVRNFFFDVAHVALVKDGSSLTLENNTALGIGVAVINFSEPGLGGTPGAGARLDGNVFWNPAGFTGTNFQNVIPSLEVHRSFLPADDGLANGADNFNMDPRLVDSVPGNIDGSNVREALSLSQGSMGIGTGPNGLDRGAAVPQGASISGAPVGVTARSSVTLTVAGPGIVSYRFQLNNDGYGAETSVTNAIELAGLSEGNYVVSVIGRNSAGVEQGVATETATWTVSAAHQDLVINEILASNDSAVVHEDEFPDLVELYNPGNVAIDLSGIGVTDDLSAKYSFSFPFGTMLGPGEYLVLYADDRTGSGFHLGFNLNQSGDALYLFASPADGGGQLDSVEFGMQLEDISIGRLADGQWALTKPTFGGPNVWHGLGRPDRLRINEWLADGEVLFFDDYVELFNPEPLPVALGGLFMTDEPIGDPVQHQIPPLTFVDAGGHVLFVADGNEDRGADHLSFRLAPEQGRIGLRDTDLTEIDCVMYGPQFSDVSEGRRPSGSDNISLFGPFTGTEPTPGGPNPGLGGATTVSNIFVDIMELSHVWRYEASGTDLGTAWRAPGFDDSGWMSGPALLYNESASLPEQNTFIPFTNPQQNTIYFRTTFNVNQDLTGFNLSLGTYIDDAAVIYLNGSELLRVRMPGGTVTYNTGGTSTVGDASLETFTVFANALQQGVNHLAVEVHQANLPSSDLVWGMRLQGVRSITNFNNVMVVINEVMANNLTITYGGSDEVTDWIELYNPIDSSVNVEDLSLSDDVTNPRRWVFPAGTTIPARGFLLVRFDPDLPESTVAGPDLNTGYGLNAGGDGVYLFDAISRGGALMDSVTFGTQAADHSIGRLPTGIGSWGLNLPTPGAGNTASTLGDPAALKVNEWMANPESGEDWFELYNPNPQPVLLSGLYLTDDLGDWNQYAIPPLSFVGFGSSGFVEFVADSDPEQGANHADFRLSAGGEEIAIFDASGGEVDSIVFGPQHTGVSEGRFPDGADTARTFPNQETPGAANILPLEDVVISEVLAHTDPPLEDAIELYNRSSRSIDISGWFLSDNREDVKQFQIPAGTVVGPREYIVFYEYQFNPDFSGRSPFFALGSLGDDVVLATGDLAGNLTGFRTREKFGTSANGSSFSRYQTSIGIDFPASEGRTLGEDTPATLEEFRMGTGLPNTGPRIGPIVITEIMYHPPDVGGEDNVLDEFIELLNIAGSPVELFDSAFPSNTWRLRDAVKFDFPPATVMAAGEYVLVVSFDPSTNATQVADWRAKYGVPAGVRMFGPYEGKLNNNDDKVDIFRPDEPIPLGEPDAGLVPYIRMDKVNYEDDAPWPFAADGSTNGVGISLQRLVPSDYGNDPINWIAGVPTPGGVTGPAGGLLPFFATQPMNQSLSPGGSFSLLGIPAGTPPMTLQWRKDGIDIPGEDVVIYAKTNVSVADGGVYTLRAVNGFGSVLSQPAIVTVDTAPVITGQPEDLVVGQGTDALFTVGAEGSAPFSYQWRKEGVDLPGANDAVLTVQDVQPPDEGSYDVIVSNGFGSVTSMVAMLSIRTPATITVQPVSVSTGPGSNVVFSVSAEGSPPIRYQWRKDGFVLLNQTNSVLMLNNVQPGDAGDYTVQVINPVGAVLSDVATLTILLPATLSIIATDPDAAEAGVNPGAFTLFRGGSISAALNVDLSVAGSATPGADYGAIPDPLIFPAGQSSLVVNIVPVDDGEPEVLEDIVVTLNDGVDYELGEALVAVVTIVDDDNVAPMVSLLTPDDGAFYPEPTNIVVSAQASDDGSIARVEFFSGAIKIGEAMVAPFEFNWANPAAGTHVLTAVATDNLGTRATSAAVTIEINAPPTVSIVSPLDGANFFDPATVTVTANALDADGTVTEVEFFEGGVSVGIDDVRPFSVVLADLPVGNYSLTARVTDDDGISRTSSSVDFSVTEFVVALADNFADMVVVGGYTNHISGDNIGATREDGEPRHAAGRGNDTVWIGWQAPGNGLATIDTFGSEFNTTLAVYTGDGIGSLFLIASNNDAGGGTQSEVTFNAVAGTIYRIAVDGRLRNSIEGQIEIHIQQNGTPTIDSQPQDVFVSEGSDVVFSVSGSGAPPLTYQWRKNGVNLPGETAPTLSILDVESDDAGGYSVVVGNSFGSVISRQAVLTIDDGSVTRITTNLVVFASTWRYEQSGTDLGTGWKEVGFDDQAWPSGSGLLGVESSGLQFPINTPLSLVGNGPGQVITYYFRTRFTVPEGATGTLRLSTMIDDAAVFYLNGDELFRLGMGDGPFDASTLAGRTVSNAALEGPFDVSGGSLVGGENVLAGEVHQTSVSSSDIVFGVNLEGELVIPNGPRITEAEMMPNGSFRLVWQGIVGVEYVLEQGTDGQTWSEVTRITNTARDQEYIDPSAQGVSFRLYRLRTAQ